jgi:predicted transcriptional regulator
METRDGLTEAAARIIAAYVANNPVKAAELPSLIQRTRAALASAGHTQPEEPGEPQKPAVSIKKSIGHDHITCLEDGKQFKSLKRHLRTDHNLEPDEYRAKWGLPKDYPIVAPAYAEARSNLARQMGLGQKGRRARA